MFFPEPIKKITQLKQTDGFLYFDPQEDIESSLTEEETETVEIRASLNKQHKIFVISSLIVVILNLLILAYWASKLDTISDYQSSTQAGSNSTHHNHIIPIVIMVLLVVHFIWILNAFLGYIFLRYELNAGIIFYFVVLNVLLFTRIALNLLVLVSTSQLNAMLGDMYSVAIYAVVMVLQILGDVGLAILAARIKYSIKVLTNLVDKKLYSETISNIMVL